MIIILNKGGHVVETSARILLIKIRKMQGLALLAATFMETGNHCLWLVPLPLMLEFGNSVRNVRFKCCTVE